MATAATATTTGQLLKAAKDVWKYVKAASFDVERCEDVVQQLYALLTDTKSNDKNNVRLHLPSSLEQQQKITLQKTLSATSRFLRAERRKLASSTPSESMSNTADQADVADEAGTSPHTIAQRLETLLLKVQTLDKGLQNASSVQDEKQYGSLKGSTPTNKTGEAGAKGESVLLPETVSEYADRLKRQKKELYKNPPALPPARIVIEPEYCPLPERHPTTGALQFIAACVGSKNNNDVELCDAIRDFTPNLTPAEVLRGGAFGGTYFRSIVSAVTNQRYDGRQVVRDTLPDEWIQGLDVSLYLTSPAYRPHVNKYKVKCGGSLGMWESSGWIADCDPYGWFQWYCRFYQGRRSSDDLRQIRRWKSLAGRKGRFRSQLCNKILAAGTHVDDASISPVIRQTLFHWGLVLTNDILEQHKQKNRK